MREGSSVRCEIVVYAHVSERFECFLSRGPLSRFACKAKQNQRRRQDIFWGSQSVGGRSMDPLRATAITGLSRDRLIVVQGRDQLTGHVG